MDHLYIPVITLHLSIVAKKTFYCNDHTITEFGITDDKNSSTAYVILCELIDTWFLDSEGWEFDRSHGAGTYSPSHWQQVEEQAPKPVGWIMCFLLMTLVPAQKLCVNVYLYIYMHSLYEFCYRTYIYIIYIYIYTTGVSFSIGEAAPHHVLMDCISGECAVPGLNATFCFLWFTNCVLLFDKSLILGCLWPLLVVLNNTLIIGVWCYTIPHLPGCFCPWTFFQNIGFNTVLTDPFI